jgi:outer membrane lipoprotein SlyB
MTKKMISWAFATAMALVLCGCATQSASMQPTEVEIRTGVIEQVTLVQIPTNQHQGVGAVLGGVVGLGLGSLIGNGTGRDVAMVLGSIGGAVVGNEVQKKHDAPLDGQQIIVRTKNGVLVSVTQPYQAGLQAGQRVYIEGSGENARVVPR